jgi:hypothetical protein
MFRGETAIHEDSSQETGCDLRGFRISEDDLMGLTRVRLFGALLIGLGILGRWYNWHLAETTGEFYIRMTLAGPAGVFGGLLLLIRPDWVGRLRADSPMAQKVAVGALLVLMMVGSGIDLYLLNHLHPRRAAVTAMPAGGFTPTFSPAMARESAPSFAPSTPAPEIAFLGRAYRLGAYNQKQNPMWELVSAGESVDDWKTLFTVIDRPDARTREEMDRLAEGILSNYKARGAKILASRTMQETAGGVFNYIVAAFEEPEKHCYELNFVKITMGLPEAEVMMYGVRITDAVDYRGKAKEFLDRNGAEVGSALGTMPAVDVRNWPRKGV